MTFTDKRGVEYVFDAKLHCGDRHATTFCIIGPRHYGKHWDGTQEWNNEKPGLKMRVVCGP